MANLRDLRLRIRSVQNTQQITKAMKMVAAARLNRAQERIHSGRPYFQQLDALLELLAPKLASSTHPLSQKKEAGKALLLVIAGDRGLCGAYNTNILRFATQYARNTFKSQDEYAFIALGRKAEQFLRFRKYPIQRSFVRLPITLPYRFTRDISDYLIQQMSDPNVRSVTLFYSRFANLARHVPTRIPLLPVKSLERLEPLNKPSDANPQSRTPKPDIQFDFEPKPEVILDMLLPKVINLRIFQALAEAMASEQAARMIAMDNATENAAEIIRSLSMEYNRARQESITKDLMDIVGGAEALK
ncbi:MAG: ATP synthase F1 subunit gamma [bacterium]